MALSFYVDGKSWQERMLDQEKWQQMGANIGTGLGMGVRGALDAWTPLGKAYQKHLSSVETARKDALEKVNKLKLEANQKGEFHSKWKGGNVKVADTENWSDEDWFAAALGKTGKTVDLDQARRAYLKDYPAAARGGGAIPEETLREEGYLDDTETSGYTPGMFKTQSRSDFKASDEWANIQKQTEKDKFDAKVEKINKKLLKKNFGTEAGDRRKAAWDTTKSKIGGAIGSVAGLPKSLWQMIFPDKTPPPEGLPSSPQYATSGAVSPTLGMEPDDVYYSGQAEELDYTPDFRELNPYGAAMPWDKDSIPATRKLTPKDWSNLPSAGVKDSYTHHYMKKAPFSIDKVSPNPLSKLLTPEQQSLYDAFIENIKIKNQEANLGKDWKTKQNMMVGYNKSPLDII